MRRALDLPFDEALQAEGGTFRALKASPQSSALRHLFFAERATLDTPRCTATLREIGQIWLQWQLGANHPQAQGKPETQQDGTGNHVGRETAAAIKASVGHIALIQDHSRGPFGLTFSTI